MVGVAGDKYQPSGVLGLAGHFTLVRTRDMSQCLLLGGETLYTTPVGLHQTEIISCEGFNIPCQVLGAILQ